MTNMINKLNGNYKKRDELLFGSYNPDKYLGGIRNFTCNLDMLKQLVQMKFASKNECQNYSPSIGDFIETCSGTKSSVIFGGYAVSPLRDDYRVTIDSIDALIDYNNTDEISLFVECFRFADEFSFIYDNDKECFVMHAWWD